MEQFKVFITRSARKCMCVCAKKRDSCNTQPPPPSSVFLPLSLWSLGLKNFYYFLFTKVVDVVVGSPFFLHTHTVFVPTGALPNNSKGRERERERTNWGGRWWSNKLLLFFFSLSFPSLLYSILSPFFFFLLLR